MAKKKGRLPKNIAQLDRTRKRQEEKAKEDKDGKDGRQPSKNRITTLKLLRERLGVEHGQKHIPLLEKLKRTHGVKALRRWAENNPHDHGKSYQMLQALAAAGLPEKKNRGVTFDEHIVPKLLERVDEVLINDKKSILRVTGLLRERPDIAEELLTPSGNVNWSQHLEDPKWVRESIKQLKNFKLSSLPSFKKYVVPILLSHIDGIQEIKRKEWIKWLLREGEQERYDYKWFKSKATFNKGHEQLANREDWKSLANAIVIFKGKEQAKTALIRMDRWLAREEEAEQKKNEW